MKNEPQRTALVTGGGRNIGRAIAQRLVTSGWFVVVADLDFAAAESVAKELGVDYAAPFACDVADEGAVVGMFESISKDVGLVTGLVNNVGITANNALIDTTLEEWNRTLAACLTSSFLCSREAGRLMIAAGRPGAIVNIGSTTAHRGNRSKVAYGVAKAGILNLTRMTAIEFAGHQIRVNTVSPALTGSPVGFSDDAVRSGQPGNVPLGRWGEPLDQANAVNFLLSEEASFITGAELLVDGGVLAAYPKGI